VSEQVADVIVLIGREQGQDAVDRLDRVGGMQGGHDQVPRVGGRESHAHGQGVADLADDEHIGSWCRTLRSAWVKDSVSLPLRAA